MGSSTTSFRGVGLGEGGLLWGCGEDEEAEQRRFRWCLRWLWRRESGEGWRKVGGVGFKEGLGVVMVVVE